MDSEQIRVITLTTDFGCRDPFAGEMKGVVLSINPRAVLVDFTHEVPPQDVSEGAFIIGSGYKYFPLGTIHVVVVDPGVGSERRPVIIEADGHYFVGPDNGLFSYVLSYAKQMKAVHITNSEYMLTKDSPTFQGRDLFAPVAAWLSKGTRLEEFGRFIHDPVRFEVPLPETREDNILGEVIYIDSFGNAITSNYLLTGAALQSCSASLKVTRSRSGSKMRSPNIFRLVIVLFFAFNLVSCPLGKSTREPVSPAKDFKSYTFGPESPLMSRLQPIPDFVLVHLKDMDKDSTYSSYSPSEKETALLAEYMDKLPALHRKVLQDRLIGIYFVQNFQGSGMAEYVLNEKDDVYTILVLNPVVLENDISTQLTYRENTCFAKNGSDLRIEVHSGSAYKGLMYVLLHEATHIVDYVLNYTPYVEDELAKIKRIKTRSTDFVKGVWTDYSKATGQYDYPLRDNVTFYGLNKGPRINISDALDLYRQLSNTPFVSVYAGQNWAEDFADFVTFYHLTQKLKQPYEIRYYKGGELTFRYVPMKAPKVMERFPLMKAIY